MNFHNYPTLSKSPLVETAICISLVGRSLCKDQVLAWAESHASDYEVHEDLNAFSLTMDLQVPENVKRTSGWAGMRLRNKGNLVITLQNEQDGSVTFAFSMLRPYSKWNQFLELSQPLIESVYTLVEATAVKRLGIRSIDRIAVDQEKARLSDIIKTVPPDLEGVQVPIIHDFIYKDTAFYSDFGLFATVIRAGRPNTTGTAGDFILDIDVFHSTNQGMSKQDALAKLPEIRELKDRLFFNTISDECLERFK